MPSGKAKAAELKAAREAARVKKEKMIQWEKEQQLKKEKLAAAAAAAAATATASPSTLSSSNSLHPSIEEPSEVISSEQASPHIQPNHNHNHLDNNNKKIITDNSSSSDDKSVSDNNNNNNKRIELERGAFSNSFESQSDPNALRTVFAKEPQEVIEARKALTRITIKRQQFPPYSPLYYLNESKELSACLSIPRRPPWNRSMTRNELESNESNYFNKWLQNIYQHFTIDRLNHFEHNLNVWRQLWRVSEVSDILLVIVDSRNPLFNFPPSLYEYITEHLNKPMVLILNKVDLVPASVIDEWIKYFGIHYPKLRVVPFSSNPNDIKSNNSGVQGQKIKRKSKKKGTLDPPYGAEELLSACKELIHSSHLLTNLSESVKSKFSFHPTLIDSIQAASNTSASIYADADEYMKVSVNSVHNLGKKNPGHRVNEKDESGSESNSDSDSELEENLTKFSGLFGSIDLHPDQFSEPSNKPNDSKNSSDTSKSSRKMNNFVTLGLIGYPNAGKSSVINALSGRKLVSVSSTPGHTKQLQTLFLNPSTRLCDSPGLVFPAVDVAKATQVVAGCFPVAQTREPYSAVQFICERVPLEQLYQLKPVPDLHDNLNISTSTESNISNNESKSSTNLVEWNGVVWSAWMICEALAYKKGYHTRTGELDVYRAANEILRDQLDGRILLYFRPPQNNNNNNNSNSN